ncbi:MAG: hypothetical protein WAV09_01105 [Minisyncoccia bacterium]
MSVYNYYLNQGYTPSNKSVAINGTDTIAVWTPTTSTRIVVTEAAISRNSAGTIAFYWGNLAGSKIAEFISSGSATVSPAIGAWASTMYDRVLFAKAGVSGTDGIVVNLTGFEIT